MKKFLKRSVAVILCIMLVAASLVFASAKDKELKFTVASDTHFQCESDLAPLSNDPSAEKYISGMLNSDVYSYAAMQGQMDYESKAIVKKMLSDFASSDSEYLLIAGDLTCGKRQSHLELAELLGQAEKDSGKQIYVICGNHDCDKKADEKYIDIDEFKSIYADFGYSEALCRHESSGSYTVDLCDDYRLIAIDSCIYGKDNGEINDSVLGWIKEQAEAAKADGKKLIGMMHHSILPHFEVQPMIKKYSSLASTLADLGIKLMFTGHIHANDISSAQSKSGNVIYDIQTGSLICAPNAYRTVTVTDEKIDIKSSYVTSIDTNDLVKGYSEKQLALIKSDFASYAWGFYEAGICKYVNRYIGSAGKLGKTLKLTEGTLPYDELDKLLRKVGKALALDIYDDGSTPGVVDSIEEIAGLADYTLPKSDYKRPYQVAAKIMFSFYHGDEETVLGGNEVPLLYDCIKAALAYFVTDLTFGNNISELLIKLSDVDLRNENISVLSKINYADNAVSKLADALLLSLTDGLRADLCSPSDINVTIDGYGTANDIENGFTINLFKKVFEKIFEIFNIYFELLFK